MTPTPPMSLLVYGLATRVLEPFASIWLRHRARLDKEDPQRWPERLGREARPRPDGPLAWLHGASVGESLSLLALAERLTAARPDLVILITSGTRAAADVLEGRLPPRAIHQYAPVDAPGAARRFLAHWRPSLWVIAESELWPTLILAAKGQGTRLAFVSARISDHSVAGWRRAPAAARALLGAFDLILARDDAAARRLNGLGGRVAGVADLKFGAEALPVDEPALRAARRTLGGRALILAASTHPGEDEIILAAFRRLIDGPAMMGAAPTLVIAPRHPARGEAVARAARSLGLTVSRRAAGAALGETQTYVADTVGELGLWYRVATLAVVGGSLTEGSVGGHNPLEPARLGCPFIAGPNVASWPIYDAMIADEATERVAGSNLAVWFRRAALGDAGLPAMAARALAFVASRDASSASAMDQILALLAP